MLTLGIHDGHNASACLMKDGEILYLVQEERICREKNKHGFPFEAIGMILKESGLKAEQIDQIGFNGHTIARPRDRKGTLDYYGSYLKAGSLIQWKKKLEQIPAVYQAYLRKNQSMRLENLRKAGFKESQKPVWVDHHSCHASAAYYGNGNFDEKVLVLTNDGSGDRLCASVSIGHKGMLERISATEDRHSVGNLYAYFTYLTGMVPLEHEYKIMGMAPYASLKGCRAIADDFHRLFKPTPDGISWTFTGGRSVMDAAPHWKEYMFLKRFDYLMGGLQLFIEEFLTAWVKACIAKTGIRKIALAGGTFMNVKANKRIMELAEVEEIFVFPSCGDESNPAGICWQLQHEKYLNKFQLGPVYWGNSVSNTEIETAFKTYPFKKKYNISKEADIESVTAELLAAGHVVGRFCDREEFGARSLGNRALLAHPGNAAVIKTINEMIKSRDFWMPFASSVSEERFGDYVADTGKARPWYMIMTYDTLPAAEAIVAGIHPYDRTVRPQLVKADHNYRYHKLLRAFEQKTGTGGLLNTSLNLHGLPLVHTPEDAFHLMEQSSLRYLAIEDYLVVKQE
jgi:carbamoyltransferase